MKKVSELEKVFGQLLTTFDENREKSLYAVLHSAAQRIGADGDDLPDSAYEAAADFIKIELRKLAQSGVELVDTLFAMIEELPVSAELKEKAKAAKPPYMFFAAVTAASLQDVDYDGLADTLISAGRAREERTAAS